MCNEHMQILKIPIQSRFEILARQSLGATPPSSARNSRC